MRLLSNGQYQDAVQTLIPALKSLTGILAPLGSSTNTALAGVNHLCIHPTTGSNRQRRSHATPPLVKPSRQNLPHEPSDNLSPLGPQAVFLPVVRDGSEEDSEDHAVHMYLRPIPIEMNLPATGTFTMDEVHAELSSCAAIVIFNLALGSQLAAMEIMKASHSPRRAQQGQRNLVKAKTLYEPAMDVFLQAECLACSHLQDARTLLLAVNNLRLPLLAVDVHDRSKDDASGLICTILNIKILIIT